MERKASMVGGLRVVTPVPKPETYEFSPKFLAWLRTNDCAACGLPGGWDAIEAAHLDSCRYGDVGNAIPLHGFACHREGVHSIHRIGKVNFSLYWGLDLRFESQRYAARYLAQQAPR